MLYYIFDMTQAASDYYKATIRLCALIRNGGAPVEIQYVEEQMDSLWDSMTQEERDEYKFPPDVAGDTDYR